MPPLKTKNLLLYYPSNANSEVMLSIVLMFKKEGYTPFLLTTCESGAIHETFKAYGIEVYSHFLPQNKTFWFKQWWFLIRFCKLHKIDFVYAHLQLTNLIAVFAQYFIKAKVVVCRHHSDYVRLGPSKMAKVFDFLIGKLARSIVAISDRVKYEMEIEEGVNPQKIVRINNAYDFDLFPAVNPITVDAIQEKYKLKEADIVLLNVGRMLPIKRQKLLLQVISALKTKGYQIKTLILGTGPLENELHQLANELNLKEELIFTGQVHNIRDYMQCADLQVHISSSEASNNVVKEFAMFDKTSIICSNVGDFEDYCDDSNSYILDKDFSLFELEELLISILERRDYDVKGKKLKVDVMRDFSISNTKEVYLKLFSNI